MGKDRRQRVKIRDDFSADQLRQEATDKNFRTAAIFEALARVLEGMSYADVAREYRVSTAAVYQWVHRFNEKGPKDFEQKHRNGRRRQTQVRNDISIQYLNKAAEKADESGSKRILAISMLLKMHTYQEVSRTIQISPSTLLSWVRKYNAGGLEELLAKKRKYQGMRVVMRQDHSAQDVRRLASHSSRRTARRLLGISYVLDGMTLADAAGMLDVSTAAVSRWCQAFNDKGIEGLKSKRERKKFHSCRSDPID